MSAATVSMPSAERDRIAANIAYTKAHLPGFAAFFKDLHALGMVAGWRDIDYVGPPRPGPKGITADRLVLESAAALKSRLKNGNH
jgi:hypothetical protein